MATKKQGKLEVNKSKVKATCDEIYTVCKDIEASIATLESEAENLKKCWSGGTKSVQQYNKLKDSACNSHNVLGRIRGAVSVFEIAATDVHKSS